MAELKLVADLKQLEVAVKAFELGAKSGEISLPFNIGIFELKEPLHGFNFSFLVSQRVGKILAGVFGSRSLDRRDCTIHLHLKDFVIQLVDRLV